MAYLVGTVKEKQYTTSQPPSKVGEERTNPLKDKLFYL